MKCVALEWGMNDENQKDYVPCDSSQAEPCILQGLLLSVEVDLCDAHKAYFANNPKSWGTVKVFDAKSGSRLVTNGPFSRRVYKSAEMIEAAGQ